MFQLLFYKLWKENEKNSPEKLFSLILNCFMLCQMLVEAPPGTFRSFFVLFWVSICSKEDSYIKFKCCGFWLGFLFELIVFPFNFPPTNIFKKFYKKLSPNNDITHKKRKTKLEQRKSQRKLYLYFFHFETERPFGATQLNLFQAKKFSANLFKKFSKYYFN